MAPTKKLCAGAGSHRDFFFLSTYILISRKIANMVPRIVQTDQILRPNPNLSTGTHLLYIDSLGRRRLKDDPLFEGEFHFMLLRAFQQLRVKVSLCCVERGVVLYHHLCRDANTVISDG